MRRPQRKKQGSGKLFNFIKSTLEEVQRTNQENPEEETASNTIFDVIKGKIDELEGKNDERREEAREKPTSILDIVENEIEKIQNRNRENPEEKTEPSVIFDKIKNHFEEKRGGLKSLLEEFNIEVDAVDKERLRMIQANFKRERKALRVKYAEMVTNLVKESQRK